MSNKYDPDKLLTYNGGSRHMTPRQAVARYREERSLLAPTDTVELHKGAQGKDSIITEAELQMLIDHPVFLDPEDSAPNS